MGLKPSERRALQEQKRLEAEREALEKAKAEEASRAAEQSFYGNDDNIGMSAEEREKLLEARAKRQSKYDGREAPINDKKERYADKSYKKLPEEEIEVKGDGYHRESFFGSHIRLITFIISVTLVMTVLGPWAIDMLVSRSREGWAKNEVQNDLADITIEDILRIEHSGVYKWESFSGFNYVDNSDTKEYEREFFFKESENLSVKLISDSDKGVPDMIILIDYNSPKGMENNVNLLKGSAEDFLKEHGYIK